MPSQKEHGIVYTPSWLVKAILDESGFDGSGGGRVIDPACGDGAFLTEVVSRILRHEINPAAKNVAKNNIAINKPRLRARLQHAICGADTNPQAVADCKQRLTAVAKAHGLDGSGDAPIRWNITCQDALAAPFVKKHAGAFAHVVGNPPYVRIQHLGEARRKTLQTEWDFCTSGSTDLYIAFFQLGLKLLAPNGTLAFITPNTWLKTRAAKTMRQHFKQHALVKTLVDFEHHQLFDNITTYSLITILQKTAAPPALAALSPAPAAPPHFTLRKGDSRGVFKTLGKIAMKNLDDDNWVLCAPAHYRRLQQLTASGTPLGQLAAIHVGITTLADRCYIFQNPRIEKEVAFITHPLTQRKTPIEMRLLRPIVKASVLKTPHDEQRRYVLFPYQPQAHQGENHGNSQSGKHRIISEEEIRHTAPLAHTYLRYIKPLLDRRDKGKPNPLAWYAFGRQQGLDTSFGEKLLTSPLNLRPNFIVWRKPAYTFYSGYCIKYDGDLTWLARQLNSDELAFYIGAVSRCYQNNYRSFAKTFLARFPLLHAPRK